MDAVDFLKALRKGLAYVDEVPVNWCPALGTVLANEEVIDGKSERGGHPVERRPMKQWMLKITAYADRLLEDLEELDWPESIKEMQRNWIGRSEGAHVHFAVDGTNETFTVFTTRPDTLFGATYAVLAPEHDLVQKSQRLNRKTQSTPILKKFNQRATWSGQTLPKQRQASSQVHMRLIRQTEKNSGLDCGLCLGYIRDRGGHGRSCP